MPTYNKANLAMAASQYGFQRDTFEKVLRLKKVLEYCQEKKLLKEHLVLKGGTAINLTVFDLPRLSVDIDMDYITNNSRDVMLAVREEISKTIKDYMESEGYLLTDRSRFSHSLDSFIFRYQNAGGNRDVLKIELNYSLRAHVLDPVYREIITDMFGGQPLLYMVDPIEIFAAKANALISRAAARDLYDFNNLILNGKFEEKSERDLLRKTIIFYATISSKTLNRFFETDAIDNLTITKIRRDLFPVLRNQEIRAHFDLDLYKNRAKEYLKELMTVSQGESDYLECFMQGEYRPDLLFDDRTIVERIAKHPMAIWKCNNM